ncbi:MAG: redoxin domain-containing protein [Candidatus Sericytochromatia bacterium]|nr:redoxin domain-containing protein [Candidatus Sericytochromatia bacterium]
MQAFEGGINLLNAANAQVLGVSINDTTSQATFARELNLSFPLLSDKGAKVAKAYESTLAPLPVNARKTFLIDRGGIIRFCYEGVPETVDLLVRELARMP